MEKGKEGLLLAPIHPKGEQEDPIFQYLGSLEGEKERHERGRVLYVAVTRARKALHLIGHTRLKDGIPVTPHRGTLLFPLWEAVGAEFLTLAENLAGSAEDGESQAATAPASSASTPGAAPFREPVLNRLPLDWRTPDPPPGVYPALAESEGSEEANEEEEALEFSWAGEKARHVGTVSHRLLRWMAERGWKLSTGQELQLSRAAIISALAGMGVLPSDLDQAADQVEKALRNTLEDERGRWILAAHTQARNEFRIADMEEGRSRNRIIDRTFIDEDGVRWIIDFKTGGHEGGDSNAFLDREQERYRNQLEVYAEMMARLEPGRPIRLGLYFPLLKGWREWTA